jgi:hypothetical protein
MKPKVLIPLATLCLIFVPMLIMSIRMDAFWVNSRYDAPFVVIPAVLLGDPLLLPPLNYYIYLALKQIMPVLKRRTILLTVICCLFFSTLLNSYTHYLWSHDAFTGFMDPQYGMLSVAGWWHFVISVLQIAIIWIYITFWIITVKQQDSHTFKAFEKALYFFMAFSIVNMSGTFVDKDLFLLKQITPDLAFTSILNASIPVLISIGLLFGMRRTHQLTQIGSKV